MRQIRGQIQLFSQTQISQWRDPTRRRNYSAGEEEFRRDHHERRQYGLIQRHTRKWRSLHGDTPMPPLAPPRP
ncbi:hypothetical protein, partial [Paractinoplanes atraurantiacus]|uniref:hypothetical protein n=1 Tax=Paractinoplanes atraurantiacus TaxID=1036182 RepID=UPI001C5484F0